MHKLITIDTPHLGTPVAVKLLEPENSCMQNILAKHGNIAIKDVLTPLGVVTGAVADLQGYGAGDKFLSGALLDLQTFNPHPIPTAYIAGIANDANFRGLTFSFTRAILSGWCSNNPLAQMYSAADWSSVFSGGPTTLNDAMVPLSSQVNGLTGAGRDGFGGFQFSDDGTGSGFIHSDGTTGLGFNGPSVLHELGTVHAISEKVIDLLNIHLSDTTVFHPLVP